MLLFRLKDNKCTQTPSRLSMYVCLQQPNDAIGMQLGACQSHAARDYCLQVKNTSHWAYSDRSERSTQSDFTESNHL